MDDRSLARDVLDGDQGALRQLLEREAGPVLRACARVLGDDDDAADAAQETFIAALAAMHQYRGEAPLRAWLLRIAIRTALRRRRPEREPIDGLDVADDAASPEELALHDERARHLRAAVASLPEPYREVIMLRYFGGLEIAAIAQTVGVPVETARTRLRRGLHRLRSVLEAEVAA